MKQSLLVTLLAAVAVCFAWPPAFASDEPAEELLREVSQAYAALERFHFEATETTTTRSGDLERTAETNVVTVAGDSGRFRVASDHPTDGGIAAFDGETTWIYFARRNQYQEIKGAMIASADTPGLVRLKNRFVSRYTGITKRVRSAKLGPPESLQVNGRQQTYRLVEATYDAPRGLAAEQIVRTYWIAADRLLVYQERSEFQARNPASGRTTTVAQQIVFRHAEVDEAVEDDAFGPALPDDAQLVATFDNENASPAGRTAAVFELSDLQGVTRRSGEFKGKVVLLDFWASWCIPCRIDLPRVEALHRELSAQGLVVLGVNDEAPEKASAFVEERGFTFPTLADAEGELFRAYEIRTIPTAVIVGRDGKVSSYLVGSHSAEELRAAIREAGIE